MKRNKPKTKKLCGKRRAARLSYGAVAILLVLCAFVLGASGFGQLAMGTTLLGLGFIPLAGCIDNPAAACDPCAPVESGRVSGWGISLTPLVDMTSVAEWTAGVLAGTMYIFPEVSGDYAHTITKQPGEGRTDEQNVGMKHTLKFDKYKRSDNTALFDKLNYQPDWYLYFVTETQIYFSGTTVTIGIGLTIDRALDSLVKYMGELTWNYKNIPSNATKPARIFDTCGDFGPAEVLGDGFGFTFDPGRASSVTFVSGTTWDIVYPLGLTNSSVPLSQATFALSSSGWPSGITLQTASIPNTGVGAVAGSFTVRVNVATATNYKEILADALPLTVTAGAYGAIVNDGFWERCDLSLAVEGGVEFAAAAVKTKFTYLHASGSDNTILRVVRSCYDAVSRNVEFGAFNTLPISEDVNVEGVTVSGIAQAVAVDLTNLNLTVNAGAAGAGSYLLHLVFTETGTDFSGNAANPATELIIPIVIT